MNILLIKTDQPTAELYLYQDKDKVCEKIWQADRKLAESIHLEIASLLNKSGKSLSDLNAIAVYNGPGSFTGLRIGHSVANALSYSLKLPIIATSSENWIKDAITKLLAGDDEKIALPHYGSPVRITKPRK